MVLHRCGANLDSVVQKYKICTTIFLRHNMGKVTFINRTTKSEGSVKLRFRLRDGRSVDLYYKSDIEASLKDLSKFTPEGNLRSKSTVYSRFLRQSG